MRKAKMPRESGSWAYLAAFWFVNISEEDPGSHWEELAEIVFGCANFEKKPPGSHCLDGVILEGGMMHEQDCETSWNTKLQAQLKGPQF